jgi:uncharacterized protein
VHLYNLLAMEIKLTDVEARVLGALLEKDITTPEYYPLSLNALMNACNQKSNREPVMNLSEEDVTQAMRGLSEVALAGAADTSDSRVRKYEHRLQEVFNFTRAETAVLCVLLLRGAQTPGELRGRTERMHRFDELSDVQAALQKLMGREPALARVLPRQPGMKESRYVQLLSDDASASGAEVVRDVERDRTVGRAAIADERSDVERMARLETEVAELREEVAELRRELAGFRKQFE